MELSEESVRSRLVASEPKRLASGADTGFAAVAVILYYRAAQPDVLLIRRAHKADDRWSGHMAFPGGRRESQDANLIATAIRETREEVGLDLALAGERVGQLDDVRAVARSGPIDLVIVPYVFVVRDEIALTLAPDEVAEAMWTPVLPMIRGDNRATRPYEHEGQKLLLPAFQVGPHLVWGLTHHMLTLLFERLR